MNRCLLVAVASLPLVLPAAPAQAGGFLSWLLGRAAARTTGAAIASTTTSSSSTNAATSSSSQPQKVYDANTLTVDQLVGCLHSSQALERDLENLTAFRANYDDRKTEAEREKARLAAEGKKLNENKTKSAVKQYNVSVDRYNKMVEDVEKQRISYNNFVDQRGSLVERYNSQCAKSYYKDDLDTARAKSGLSMASNLLPPGKVR